MLCVSHTYHGHATSLCLAGGNNDGEGGGEKTKAASLFTHPAANRTFDVPGPAHDTRNARHSWNFLITSFGVPPSVEVRNDTQNNSCLWTVYV